MVRLVTITRWTPQTVRALEERWNAVTTGKAPKVVLDAFAKYKIITFEISMGNNFAVMVFEIDDTTVSDIVARWLIDVCTFETYPVCSFDDYLKEMEALPLEKIPKPESWTK